MSWNARLQKKYGIWACLNCLFERALQFFSAFLRVWLDGVTELQHEEIIKRQKKVDNIIDTVDYWIQQQSDSEYDSDYDYLPKIDTASPRQIVAGAPRVTVPNGKWSQAYVLSPHCSEPPPVAAKPRHSPQAPYEY